MKYVHDPTQIIIGKINTSEKEIKDLIKAWIAISIAFAVVLRGAIQLSFYKVFIIAAVTVGTGFLLHELGHKIVAQRYGCFAEFRSFDQMLLLAIIMSIFLKVIFAAPGAVMISGPVGIRRNGRISAAGPVVNLILALFFYSILLISEAGLLKIIAFYGFFINSWLALFNMLPLWNLDGAKVLRWDKKIYGIIVAVAVVFLFLQNFISM
ncbi:peptidase M50 [archaeon]|jgi:Zn-dependent protease|nr:peptidase M50 [archaeon]MDP6547760.1 peptidase M50 [Candidatus Woesearchaeota archaeon]|tara:strand:+ start:55194 stop:55820 length:627 start_codon:yes stop_codon:yes gene_type:complete